MHVFIWHKWKGMLTWNRSLKMKHLKKKGKNILSMKSWIYLCYKFCESQKWFWWFKFEMSFIKIMIMICQIEWIENEWWFFSWMIVTCIPCIHDMIFMQFFVFMKGLSHHPIIFFLVFLMWWYEYMKYSLIYFDVYKWKVMIMHDRI